MPNKSDNYSDCIETIRVSNIDLGGGELEDSSSVVMPRGQDNLAGASSYQDSGDSEESTATVPYFRPGVLPDDDAKTVIIRSNNEPVLPALNPAFWVQGWLVIISGPMKGRSYPLTAGNNIVGSSPESRIRLEGDPGISRKQLSICYDEEFKEYSVSLHDESTQISRLIRVDGRKERIVQTTSLQRGDIIQLSRDTSARFVPFCGEAFDWQYESQSENDSLEHDLQGRYPLPVEPLSLHSEGYTQPTERYSTSYTSSESVPTEPYPRDGGDSRTVIFRDNSKQLLAQLTPAEWVQGWLVAVTGPMQGRAFPVTYGYNKVGRSPECQICLPSDPSISFFQFNILYDHEENETIVYAHSASSQTTRLVNTEGARTRVSSAPSIVNLGDVLVASKDTSLRYVPFCDDKFCWEY